MSLRIISFSVATLCLMSACSPRSFNGDVAGKQKPSASANASFEAPKGPTVASSAEPTWVFHWSPDARVAASPLPYISGVCRDAHKNNANIQTPAQLVPPSVGGDGLYVATDPFASREYGNVLVMMQIAPGKTAANALSGDDKEYMNDVKSPADMFIYFWTGVGGLRWANRAVVLRSEQVVIPASVTAKVINWRQLEAPLATVPAFDPAKHSNVKTLLIDYAPYFPLLTEAAQEHAAVGNFERKEFRIAEQITALREETHLKISAQDAQTRFQQIQAAHADANLKCKDLETCMQKLAYWLDEYGKQVPYPYVWKKASPTDLAVVAKALGWISQSAAVQDDASLHAAIQTQWRVGGSEEALQKVRMAAQVLDDMLKKNSLMNWK